MHGVSGGHAYKYWCMFTFQPRCQAGRGMTGTCTEGYTEVHMLVHNYAKGLEQMWGVRWTCIHILMHVNILTKVWDMMTGANTWDHTDGDMFSTLLYQSGGAGMGGQADIHICTDACTHYKPRCGTKEGWQGHACLAAQGCTFCHNYAKGLEQILVV